ncbi:MAG: DUF3078 domain-containing protein [Lentimicrobiaceae bacterium]|nr:DUF3078 domain-containing protein [Lentimicrobiaceae bacterium]
MRVFVLALSLFMFVPLCYAQKDVIVAAAEKAKGDDGLVDTLHKSGTWKFGGNFQLAFNQFYASNWGGAGDPYLGLGTLDRMFLTYNKGKFAWRTTLDLDFGWRYSYNTTTKEKRSEKTSDKLEFNTQIGYKAGGRWYYTMLLNAYSQMIDGKKNDTIRTSTFMTPGYVTLSIGMEHKRKDWSWYISPLAARLNCKLDNAFFDQTIAGVDSGKKVLAVVGAFTRIAYNADIHPKVNLNTKLELFYNYLGEYAYLRNLATNFEMIWNFSITDWLSVSFKTALAYDYTVKFPVFNKDGVLQPDHQTDHVQFQESFGLVLGYKFKIPKK